MALSDAELLARLRSRQTKTIELLGMELLDLRQADGFIQYRMRADAQFCNPAGTMQGGLVATALDEAASTAAIIQTGRRVVAPTIEFKVSFFGPARLDMDYLFTGRVLKAGRAVTFTEADMTDLDGKLLARLTSSCVIVDLKGPGLFTKTPMGTKTDD